MEYCAAVMKVKAMKFAGKLMELKRLYRGDSDPERQKLHVLFQTLNLKI